MEVQCTEIFFNIYLFHILGYVANRMLICIALFHIIYGHLIVTLKGMPLNPF